MTDQKKQTQSARELSPYEKNYLRKQGISETIARATTAPVEYLGNTVEFCDLELYVNESVLIPRVETEELVTLAAARAKSLSEKLNRPLKIVDVGTGSGAIALAVGSKLAAAEITYQITGLDISEAALDVAQKNLAALTSHNVSFKKSNLLSEYSYTADLIIANLPYIPSDRIAQLDESVTAHEPHLALDGGADGLDLIRMLLKQAETKLSENGIVLLEVDITHTAECFAEFADTWSFTVTTDQMEGIRFVELQKK